MKKHRFHFSKESRESMEAFDKGIRPEAAPDRDDDKVTPPAEEPGAGAAEPEKAADDNAPFVVVSRTDVGKVRASNQDAVIVSGLLCGVADGMGGHRGGETASTGARDRLIDLLDGRDPDPTVLNQAIRSVNRRLYLQQLEDENLSGMGTTLTVLWIGPESVYIGHVGDSRAYRLRDGEFRQITEDHSLVMEMVRAGVLTREQADAHPMKNVITRAVGTEEGIEVDLMAVVRKPGDIWLVCSDGLHGLVSDDDMKQILEDSAPEKAADLLLQAALDAGGRDNISLVILVDREGGQ